MSEQTTAFTPVTTRRERGDNLVFPALLIALGGLFLLGNFGVIPPLSIRSLLSLWPLIPVLIGIQLLVGRERPSLAQGLQLGVLVLGLAFVMLRAYTAPFTMPVNVAPGAPAIAGAPEVAVSARDIHFSLSEIRLPAGEVNLTLRNDGVLPHDLTIPALGVHIAAGSGRSVTTGLRGLSKGRYEGFCGVSGHADAGMRITVTVD